MSTKHTPGPWELRLDGMGGFSALIFPVGSEYPVASVTGYHSSVGQRLPNARLIAAAPDLLDVLQELIDSEYEFASVARKARLVIANATGTPPPSDTGAETP